MVANDILQRVAAGEATAVDECLAAYRGLVWSLARRSTPNLSDAEDAVQEIFIEIWRNAARFDSTLSSESTYITMIAKRRLIDRFRRRKRLDTVSLSTETSVDVTASSLGDVVERNEEVSRVREKMHQLRREDQMILELSLEQGMSHSEIAAATSMPLGTVKTRVRRGLIRLRELLGQNSSDGEERSRS